MEKVKVALQDEHNTADHNLNARDVYDRTALHWAAEKDSNEIVRLLVDYHADVTVQDEHGLTPLHIAVDEGSSLTLAELLTTKCDINAKDNSGSTPLHLCVLKGHAECLTQLLKAGARINELNHADESPAHVAAARIGANTLILLIEAGADLTIKNEFGKTAVHAMAAWGHCSALEAVSGSLDLLNARDMYGKTPLHLASSWDKAKAVQVLLEAGVDVNVKDDDGKTALHYAALWGNALCVKLLLNAGADRTIQDKQGKTTLHDVVQGKNESCVELLMSSEVTDQQQKDGQTALHVAALAGSDIIMKKLLDNGANIHITDQKGQTVLHCLAVRGTYFEVLHPFDPDINARDKHGRTALHHAVWNGNTEFAAALIEELEADVNAEDIKGMTPLQCAAYRGMADCVELLVNHQADVNARDKERRSVLVYAAIGASVPCIQLLMKNDIMPSRRDWIGQSAIHYAAKLGHAEAVSCLLEIPKVGVNAVDKHNDSPLHLAVQNSHNQVVYTLVNSGKADLGLKNNQGKLAIDIAFTSYNKEIFQFLLDKITAKYDGIWMHEFLTSKITESGQSDRMRELVRSQPESAKVVFDGCIKKTPDQQGYVSVDFQYLDDLKQNPSMHKSNHPMHILASYGYRGLLSHPLLLLCLKRKWRIAFMMYIMFLLYYTLFVLLFVANMLSSTSFVAYPGSQTPAQDSSSFFNVSPLILYTLAAIGIIIELVQVFLQGKKYLEWHNLLDWLSYIGVIVAVTSIGDTDTKTTWQWEFGCFVVLLQCMNLLFFLRVFPRFGIYVVMVSLILKTFIESFIVLFLFIVAFAMTFYLLLFNQYAFSTPGYSIMKSLVMMLGEIDFGDIFHAYKESPSPETILHFELLTYAVMCGFLLISVIIVNLLTGLAVSDVQLLRDNSESQMLAMQIDLALDLQFALLKWKKLHDRIYDHPSSIMLPTSLVDMKQLNLLARWRHSVLNFFQGPLYRQDIILKIINIIDEREYSKNVANKDQQVSADAKHLAQTLLDKFSTKKSSKKTEKSNASASNVVQVKPKQGAWSDADAGTKNLQRQLELKVDLLSKDVKECMTLLKTILDKQ